MPRITNQCLEDIKTKVDILDVVSPYVTLKRSGSKWKGLSPFNSEKSPSFFVNVEKNLFNCFSSGKGGDAIRFIETVENVNFNEAIELLADRFNVPLEYEAGFGKNEDAAFSKKDLFGIHEVAAQYYHECFKGEKSAVDYWTGERSFTEKNAGENLIGYSPPSEKGLLKCLVDKGYKPEAIAKSGLYFAKNESYRIEHLFPRFRGRLMIPIRDIQGRIIAFTARKLITTPDDGPSSQSKYINSPETPVFYKSKVLFGLNQARTRVVKDKCFLLVEGQIDALRCHSEGILTAIAPQGTAITEDQLLLLKRYTPDYVECILDGDSAGQKAALRMLPMALRVQLPLRFVVMPEGMDPDTFILKNGVESFHAQRSRYKTPIAFAINSLSGDKSPSTSEEKLAVLQGLFPIIAECSSLVLRDEFLEETANTLRVNLAAILNDFERYQNKNSKPHALNNIAENVIQPDIISVENESGKLTTAEYDLLFLILHYENLSVSISQTVNSDWIKSTNSSGMFLQRLLVELQEELWSPEESIDHLLEDESDRNIYNRILSAEPNFDDPLKTANDIIRKLFKDYFNDKIKEMKMQLELIVRKGASLEERTALQRELTAARQLIKQIPKIEKV